MFESYKNRIARHGANMSEMLRAQSNMVIEQTWFNDPNARRVYVVKVSRGLPQITAMHNLVDVKFNVDTYQKAGVDEPAYYLQFRHEAEKRNPDIAVGSYVYMVNEDGEWQWWLIIGYDERPQFRQYHIVETNYKLGWVLNDTVYYHLVVLRGGSTGDVDENAYTSIVDGTLSMWLPTTDDSVKIGYNQRFLISDKRRPIPLAWEVYKIDDTNPFGITKLRLKQATFNPAADNAEMMLADFYADGIEPTEPIADGVVTISYSGTKPTIKVGGSYKTFTPTFSVAGTTVSKWIVSDESGDIGSNENYAIEQAGDILKIKVGLNYNLVGTILIVQCIGSDGSTAKLSVEVV